MHSNEHFLLNINDSFFFDRENGDVELNFWDRELDYKYIASVGITKEKAIEIIEFLKGNFKI